MGLFNWFDSVVYTRYKDGSHFYKYITEDYGKGSSDLLEISQNHPLLTPALLFISQLFAQAKFKVRNKKTLEEVSNHWLIDLMYNPNYYQSGIDLLENLMFLKMALGSAVIYKKSPSGNKPSELFILNPNLIKYPKDFETKMDFRTRVDNRSIVYDEKGENIKIKLKDLIFFYDLPNGLTKSNNKNNHFKAESRIKGLMQVLLNTNDSLLAENIILKSNGKELITSDKTGFPLTSDEKENVENMFNSNYGLSKKRSRALITKVGLKWQSLHIALRDLGLGESVKTSANIIYTALHIPKDILSLDNKKTTYANQKESMVSYIQNEMQGALNDLTNSITLDMIEDGLELVGTYEHLPVMQFILLQKYEIESKRASALKGYLDAGMNQKDALDLLDLSDLTLKEMPNENANQNANTGTQGQ